MAMVGPGIWANKHGALGVGHADGEVQRSLWMA